MILDSTTASSLPQKRQDSSWLSSIRFCRRAKNNSPKALILRSSQSSFSQTALTSEWKPWTKIPLCARCIYLGTHYKPQPIAYIGTTSAGLQQFTWLDILFQEARTVPTRSWQKVFLKMPQISKLRLRNASERL